MYNHKPCIDTSAMELFRLSLILGIPLGKLKDPASNAGTGAFGISLAYEQKRRFGELHVAYSSDFENTIEKPMGSGYSLFFAKHLACGSLPFGVDAVHGSLDQIRTIFVDGAIRDTIQRDKQIRLQYVCPWHGRAAKVLLTISRDEFGNILGTGEPDSNKPQVPEDKPGSLGLMTQGSKIYIQHWPRAVDGIAFGGLAPQSTWDLVTAIKFTALGGLQTMAFAEDVRRFDNLILEVIRRVDEAKQFHLFGKYRLKEGRLYEGSRESPLFPDGGNDLRVDTMTAARTFSIYMTLLECVTAQYHRSYGRYTERGGTSDFNASVDDVFNACSIELDFSYCRAVTANTKESLDTQATCRGKQQSLKIDEGGHSNSHVPEGPDRGIAPKLIPEVSLSPEIEGTTQEAQMFGGMAETLVAPKAKETADHVKASVNEILQSDQVLYVYPELKGTCGHSHELDDKDHALLGDAIKHLAIEISNPADKNPFCRYRCGKIARFIIAAWACQVQPVVWDDEDITQELKDSGREYHVMHSPDDLPQKPALGGY